MNDPATIRRLYGRRQGHKLRVGQAALVEETLDALSVPRRDRSRVRRCSAMTGRWNWR